jgi:hypothetical protein
VISAGSLAVSRSSVLCEKRTDREPKFEKRQMSRSSEITEQLLRQDNWSRSSKGVAGGLQNPLACFSSADDDFIARLALYPPLTTFFNMSGEAGAFNRGRPPSPG